MQKLNWKNKFVIIKLEICRSIPRQFLYGWNSYRNYDIIVGWRNSWLWASFLGSFWGTGEHFSWEQESNFSILLLIQHFQSKLTRSTHNISLNENCLKPTCPRKTKPPHHIILRVEKTPQGMFTWYFKSIIFFLLSYSFIFLIDES